MVSNQKKELHLKVRLHVSAKSEVAASEEATKEGFGNPDILWCQYDGSIFLT